MPWLLMAPRFACLRLLKGAPWRSSVCLRAGFQLLSVIALSRSSGTSPGEAEGFGASPGRSRKRLRFAKVFQFQFPSEPISNFAATAPDRCKPLALPCHPGQAPGKPLRCLGYGPASRDYHVPVFGMLAQGSATGSGLPFCSSSIEIPSGVLMKAMFPSRGGRLMVMPFFCRSAQ